MDEISRTNNANKLSSTSLAQPELQDFSSLESSLPPLDEELLSLVPDVPPPDQGINLALINSRATSLALESTRERSSMPESNRSTPVPRPIKRENFPPFHRPVPTLAPTGTAPAPTQPIPTPSTDREDSMDIILDHPGLNSLITVLNGQWEMFIKARESRDISMMRFSLNAAAGTQEMIQNRVGREEMIRLSLNWNAREELASMDAPYRPQNLIQNQNLPPAHHVAGSIPVLNNSNVGLPPPPPPPPQPAPMVDQYMSHHQVSSRPQSRHDQYSAPMGYGYQHQPPYHHPAGYATNQFQPRPPGNWRGSGRNRRRPPSATVDIMRMGQFFVRAEAVMGRMRRIHQNRASQRPPQTRNPPPAPH
ncbi:hypothetical protein PSTG_13371 [Puccinia striiformis f. sp. tritici PST-78]|uniref:Uncharacterized protein n=1 Tax=Puccinia striiformis f. sp. tritici PST-78 TaxID=1165861 RepID=A0A0L0V2P5_9BASI|nr:hypothetical protein PSTG_13371 [Puccinia striiformis f. sp. tritici PST-78]